MHHTHRFLKPCIAVIACLTVLVINQNRSFAEPAQEIPPVTDKIKSILSIVTPRITKELAEKGFQLGAPLFIRIFKLPAELEVWIEKDERYELFRSYPICNFSGYTGPKLKEGDWQSPEGFYTVTAEQMNPLSSYHLSFNIGYPNEYDKLHNRSGGNIMVHGNCSSMGCFAMNNYRIEEIYALVHIALTDGQKVIPVHIFPFPMTEKNMEKFQYSPWIDFWQNLKAGFDVFEKTRLIPEIKVAGGRYDVTGAVKLALSTSNTEPATPVPASPRNHQYKSSSPLPE